MTDKQIIIDGVDVSGCEHRCDTHKTLLADGHIMEFANYCQITNDGCYAVDCYYKQLKRSEAQCEAMFVSHTDLEKKYKAKEQECERLKYRLKKIAEFRHDYCMDCEDLLKPSHSCKGCNMVTLKHIIEGK